MNDPTARDYGHVKTPILAFLISHELFRIEMAERFPPPPKVKVARTTAVTPAKTTGPKLKQQRADKRYLTMLSGGPLTTRVIASRMALSHMGCLSNLYSLEERKLIKRSKIRGDHKAINWEVA